MKEFSSHRSSGGASGPARRPIIQIHPSLKCNLSCAHCYSNSAPTARLELEPETICQAIADAASMGYEVVSVSGGEPLLYDGLERILAHARSLNLQTTITTNGFFNDRARLERLRDKLDALAISLDGPPEVHNRIRRSARAFDRLSNGLADLRATGIQFGFIHTLTRENWEHLPWVAEFAAENRARLLQIHPLELAGRAVERMRDDQPTEEMLARVYVLAFLLASKYAETMAVQIDLLYREHLREEPEIVYAGTLTEEATDLSPAQLLGLIVLEPDGTIVPVSYGFSRQYQICNVRVERLTDAWRTFLARRYGAFRKLCHRVWEELCAPEAPLLSNWHEVIVSRSHTWAPYGLNDSDQQSPS